MLVTRSMGVWDLKGVHGGQHYGVRVRRCDFRFHNGMGFDIDTLDLIRGIHTKITFKSGANISQIDFIPTSKFQRDKIS